MIEELHNFIIAITMNMLVIMEVKVWGIICSLAKKQKLMGKNSGRVWQALVIVSESHTPSHISCMTEL